MIFAREYVWVPFNRPAATGTWPRPLHVGETHVTSPLERGSKQNNVRAEFIKTNLRRRSCRTGGKRRQRCRGTRPTGLARNRRILSHIGRTPDSDRIH